MITLSQNHLLSASFGSGVLTHAGPRTDAYAELWAAGLVSATEEGSGIRWSTTRKGYDAIQELRRHNVERLLPTVARVMEETGVGLRDAADFVTDADTGADSQDATNIVDAVYEQEDSMADLYEENYR